MTSDAALARRAVAENPVWYHAIELAPGVVTPGHVDLRSVAGRVLPDQMNGMRALDVGTFDGFWAFEMERRGAEVVAIDVERLERAEWPPVSRLRMERELAESELVLGRGFELAAAALGSGARRMICSVYDLDRPAIGGAVDFAFVGALLLHLRDPVRALERVHDALAPGGEMRIVEPFSPGLTLRSPRRPAARFQAADSDYNWWYPNLATLTAWPLAAGFVDVARGAIVRPPAASWMRQFYAAISARRPAPNDIL